MDRSRLLCTVDCPPVCNCVSMCCSLGLGRNVFLLWELHLRWLTPKTITSINWLNKTFDPSLLSHNHCLYLMKLQRPNPNPKAYWFSTPNWRKPSLLRVFSKDLSYWNSFMKFRTKCIATQIKSFKFPFMIKVHATWRYWQLTGSSIRNAIILKSASQCTV